MAQLSVSNDDLRNVLSSVSMPYVIVGMDLRIRRFSTEASRLLSLIPGDVGRPIGYLGGALNAPQIESMVSETINSVRERSQRVRCSDGHWYTARIVPYRTADHAIRGAIVEFLKALPARKIGEMPEIHELVGKVLSTLPHMLILLDENLRIMWVNKAFFEAFVLGAEIVGRALDEVWTSASKHGALWSALEETASGRKPFDDIVVPGAFGRDTGRKTKFSARFIPAEGERSALTLLMMEDIGKGTGA
jgi:two-component system CheB/CheR fusion protein